MNIEECPSLRDIVVCLAEPPSNTHGRMDTPRVKLIEQLKALHAHQRRSILQLVSKNARQADTIMELLATNARQAHELNSLRDQRDKFTSEFASLRAELVRLCKRVDEVTADNYDLRRKFLDETHENIMFDNGEKTAISRRSTRKIKPKSTAVGPPAIDSATVLVTKENRRKPDIQPIIVTEVPWPSPPSESETPWTAWLPRVSRTPSQKIRFGPRTPRSGKSTDEQSDTADIFDD